MDNNFDLIVIGAGPGGYVCAIRASQLGIKTACVEMNKTLGGTCLNVGCIPSKSLLNSSEQYHKTKKELGNLGIEVNGVKLNLLNMMQNKSKSVQILTKGIEFLFKKNKITHLKGEGTISSSDTVTVKDDSGKKINYKTKNIVISTGSTSTSLTGINIDEKIVVSSTGALSFEAVPKKLIVIGGGYIGLELSSVWKRLGADVTVVEFLDHIIPGMDKDISDEFLKILKKQGINFKLEKKVTAVRVVNNKAIVDFTDTKSGIRERIECNKVLIAIGRKSNFPKGISESGIKFHIKEAEQRFNKTEVIVLEQLLLSSLVLN